MHERDDRGRFMKGNKGGPGRPLLVIEVDYLVALSDAVHIDDWVKIVERAVADAKKGDDKARAWLSRYLLGDDPPRLFDIAIRMHLGISTKAEIEAVAEDRMKSPHERNLDALKGRTQLRRALELSGLDRDKSKE